MKTILTFKRTCELINAARMCEICCLDNDAVIAIVFERPTTSNNKLIFSGYNKHFTQRQFKIFTEKDLFFVDDGCLFINDEFMIHLYVDMEIPDEAPNAL